MCYNYSNLTNAEDGRLMNKYNLRIGDRQKLVEKSEAWEKFRERFNFYYTSGFEHKALPVITMEEPGMIQFFQWGLIPHWVRTRKDAQEIRIKTLNAKCESVFSLPSFRESIKTRRCLIPATSFFEWREVASKKYPYCIEVTDDLKPSKNREFCMAGVYSVWVDPDGGELYETFSVITTPANEMMRIIHHGKERMPLILKEEDEDRWLDPSLSEMEIRALMIPYSDNKMRAYTICKLLTAKGLNRNVPEVLMPEAYLGVDEKLKVKSAGYPIRQCWAFLKFSVVNLLRQSS